MNNYVNIFAHIGSNLFIFFFFYFVVPRSLSTLPVENVEVHHSDASSGPSTSGLGSALPRRPQVIQSLPGVIPPTPTPTPPGSPTSSPEEPLATASDGGIANRRTANDNWSRVAQLGVDHLLGSELTVQTRTHRPRRIMVSFIASTCTGLYLSYENSDLEAQLNQHVPKH